MKKKAVSEIQYDQTKMLINQGILMAYYAKEPNVVIPKGVFGIAKEAFKGVRDFLYQIQLPQTLLWIGPGAFSGCTKLAKVLLPETLVEISDEAFIDCRSLLSITTPSTLYQIGRRAFAGCTSLSSAALADGLVHIEQEAFRGCTKLTKVEIPRSCAYLGKDIFANCPKVVIHANADTDAADYAQENQIKYQRVMTNISLKRLQEEMSDALPEYVIRNGVLVEYNGCSEDIVIPSDVRVLGESVFEGNLQMQTITFPKASLLIAPRALSGCDHLTRVESLKKYLYICEDAFSMCSQIHDVIIAGSGTTIRKNAFRNCPALTNVVLPDDDVYVEEAAFAQCTSLRNVKLPITNGTVSEKAFDHGNHEIQYYLSCRATLPATIKGPASIVLYHYDQLQYIRLLQACKERNITPIHKDLPISLAGYTIENAPEPEVKLDEIIEKVEVTPPTPEVLPEVIDEADYKQIPLSSNDLAIWNCDVLFEGQVISEEQVSRQLIKYLLETMSANDHNEGIILHSGAQAFNAMLLSIATMKALLLNEATPADVVSSLYKGDLVLYNDGKGNSKYEFSGYSDIKGKKFITLIKKDKSRTTCWVPELSWHRIKPYYGNSSSTTDVGIRKHDSDMKNFCNTVLGIPLEEIPAAPDASIVVLTSNSNARMLMDKIVVQSGETQYSLKKMVTAAYYTENGVNYFAGNPGKNDPILKFTDNVFVARRMIAEPEANRIVGVLVLGEEYVTRSYAELTDIISDKGLKFVYVSSAISDFCDDYMLREHDKATVFVCSPEYIASNLTMQPRYYYADNQHAYELYNQLKMIQNREQTEIVIPSELTGEEYQSVRNEILSFKYAGYDSEEKDLFVKESYSALNLLMSAVFPITAYSRVLGKPSFEERLETIRQYSSDFPLNDKKKANDIIESIHIMYLMVMEKNGKRQTLQELILQNSQGVALIVPKAQYEKILSEVREYRQLIKDEKLFITTATRFDNTRRYDAVIYISNKTDQAFSPLRCFSAKRVIGLLYECEIDLFAAEKQRMSRLQTELNRRSYYPTEVEGDSTDVDVPDGNPLDISHELDEYFAQVSRDYWDKSLEKHSNSVSTATAETAIMVGFEEGEYALFTKRYKPYVLNETTGSITTPDISKLAPGDLLVFNTDYWGTRDIVNTILEKQLVYTSNSEKLQEAYQLSQYWKTVLRDYCITSGKQEKEVAAELKAQGVSVEVGTILSWMDPDCNTVRPRDPAAFQQIGYVVDDQELFTNPDKFIRACDVIYKKRGEILQDISKTMIALLTGNQKADNVPDDIRDMIRRLAGTYRIHTIVKKTMVVSTSMVNHPMEYSDY